MSVAPDRAASNTLARAWDRLMALSVPEIPENHLFSLGREERVRYHLPDANCTKASLNGFFNSADIDTKVFRTLLAPVYCLPPLSIGEFLVLA